MGGQERRVSGLPPVGRRGWWGRGHLEDAHRRASDLVHVGEENAGAAELLVSGRAKLIGPLWWAGSEGERAARAVGGAARVSVQHVLWAGLEGERAARAADSACCW